MVFFDEVFDDGNSNRCNRNSNSCASDSNNSRKDAEIEQLINQANKLAKEVADLEKSNSLLRKQQLEKASNKDLRGSGKRGKHN